jgi:hypothetical protein
LCNDTDKEYAVVPLFNKATHPADKKWFEKEDGLS